MMLFKQKIIGPIAIIGAGAGGLYAAMILKDLGLDYQIIEATNRCGGRVRTHKFGSGQNHNYIV
jgi:phytoene dehydrogenase-like protein